MIKNIHRDEEMEEMGGRTRKKKKGEFVRKSIRGLATPKAM